MSLSMKNIHKLASYAAAMLIFGVLGGTNNAPANTTTAKNLD